MSYGLWDLSYKLYAVSYRLESRKEKVAFEVRDCVKKQPACITSLTLCTKIETTL